MKILRNGNESLMKYPHEIVMKVPDSLMKYPNENSKKW